MWFLLVFVLALSFRLWTLSVSLRHEKALKAAGATEFDTTNSMLLAIVHALFYLAALLEAFIRRPRFDQISLLGLVLYLASVFVLLTVIRLLGRFWTLKLILAKDHVLLTHPLFTTFRHPNYFLAIVPELLGLALCLHAFATLFAGGLLYAVPLYRRIREEERLMKTNFPAY